MAILYCSFAKNVGWRVVGSSETIDRKIGVVSFKGRKCLQIPSIDIRRGGNFCNPKKLALTYVRSLFSTRPIQPGLNKPLVVFSNCLYKEEHNECCHLAQSAFG